LAKLHVRQSGTAGLIGGYLADGTQEVTMTDYRDPNYRDPDRTVYRDPKMLGDDQSWSNATWGWIAGLAIVVLVLVFAFGTDRGPTTADTTVNPPATTGQGTTPPARMNPQAPAMPPAPAPERNP
jgi:hypothetical protein